MWMLSCHDFCHIRNIIKYIINQFLVICFIFQTFFLKILCVLNVIYLAYKIYNIEPHEAAPEVSKGKVHITQDKHVPVEIDSDFLNPFHSISHATLS